MRKAAAIVATLLVTSVTVSAQLPDACSLVTHADVEAAVGPGASARSAVNPRTGKHKCHVKPGSTGDIDEVIVAVDRVYQWDAMKKAALPPTGSGHAVSGMGGDAFEGPATGYFVRKGNLYVQVFGSVLNKGPANEKATRYLAERAAAHLP